MGGSVNLNAGANQQNWRQFETNKDKNIDFEAKAKAIAQMIYGSGRGEAEKGGAGHIGLIGNKVLKFNTKWGERHKLDKNSVTYQDMKESCNNLREELKAMADVAGLKGKALDDVLHTLGFKGGKIGSDADLLKRTTAADVLKTLVDAYQQKMKAETQLTIAEVWEGHTPTYGNSVESFRQAVNDHNNAVYAYIRDERTALVNQVVREAVDSKHVASIVRDGVKQNFAKHCVNIKQWLAKTNSFFLGLVPDNPKTKDQLLSLKARMQAQVESTSEKMILGKPVEKTIVDILDELKGFVQAKDATVYVPTSFENKNRANKEYTTFEDVMKDGLEAVNTKFDEMLKGLSEVKFADGSNYPNLSQSLEQQKIPKEFRPIAEDIQSLARTFKDAVSEFRDIGEYTTDVELHVDYKVWNNVNTERVDKAVEEFDANLKKMGPDAKSDDWANLAKSLVKMRNVLYYAEGVTTKNNRDMFSTFFNIVPMLVKRPIEDAEIAGVKSEADFKALVTSLVSVKGKGLFFGERVWDDENLAAPNRILKETNPLLNLNKEGPEKEKGKLYETSMKYFSRLHDLASKFDIIDRKGVNVSYDGYLQTDEEVKNSK